MKNSLLVALLFISPLLAWSQADSTQSKVDSVLITASIKGKLLLQDSLNDKSALLDSITENTDILSNYEQLLIDSLENLPQLPTIDSTTIVKEAESKVNEELSNQNININLQIPKDSAAIKEAAKQKVNQELSDQLDIDLPDIQFDSTLVDDLSAEGEKRVEEALKNSDEYKGLEGSELNQLTDMKEEIELTQQEIKQVKAKKELKQKMASQAKEFISDHADELQQIQGQMGELKQKYSSVLNSNDLSTAKKRSSLEDEPLGKRLTYGANFNISGTDPLTIDFAPTIGYRFNKLFEAGIAGMYRGKFGGDNALNVESDQVYGYGVYVRHDVYRNFFGYIEGENINQATGTAELRKRAWQQTLLAGVGRTFKISKLLELQTIITYNFLHENNDGVYNNPVVFKTGVRVVK